MVIPVEHYAAACQVAKRVYAGEIRRSQGVRELTEQFQLNEGSAGDYINDYKCLVEGRIFFRKMSAAAMRHFILEIETEHGAIALINALASLNAHIAYIEGHYKTIAQSLRDVADEFSVRLSTSVSVEDVVQVLFDGVGRTISEGSQEKLHNRLAVAPKKPRSVNVQATVFLRNPDVVAAVLERAGGVCEGCYQDAPFISAATGQPYLEIHHVIRLADDGDDTVENALALCPNCHRQAHFGVS